MSGTTHVLKTPADRFMQTSVLQTACSEHTRGMLEKQTAAVSRKERSLLVFTRDIGDRRRTAIGA